MIQQYDPKGIFEQNEVKGGVCQVKDVFFTLLAVTNNQVVISGITGKRIVILHGQITATSAAGYVLLNSNPGGNRKGFYIPASTTIEPNVFFGDQKWGYMRTATSQSIVMDNLSAQPIWVSLTYIEVTP